MKLHASVARAPKAGGIVGAAVGGAISTLVVRDVDGLLNFNQVVRVDAGVIMGAIAHPISTAMGNDEPSSQRSLGVEERIHDSRNHVFVAATTSTELVTRITVRIFTAYWVEPASRDEVGRGEVELAI